MRSDNTKCISVQTNSMIHKIKLTNQNLLIDFEICNDPQEKNDFFLMALFDSINDSKVKKGVKYFYFLTIFYFKF